MSSAGRDTAVAQAVMEAFEAAGVGVAVIHGEHLLAEGAPLSDLDLVSERPARAVLLAARAEMDDRGLAPILLWPYDSPGGTSVFVVDSQARTGAQIDLLYDPGGRGKYGLRTARALAAAEPGTGFRCLDPDTRDLYLLRKRQWKQDWEQVGQVRRVLADRPETVLQNVAEERFHPVVGRQLLGLLEHDIPARIGVGWRTAELRRRVRRAVSPIGVWVHFQGSDAESAAKTAAVRLSAVLPVATPARHADEAGQMERFRTIRRPAAWVTWGERGLTAPDVVVHSTDLDPLGVMVGLLAKRIWD